MRQQAVRRLWYILARLLAGLGSQVAVLWAAVLIGKSQALEPLRNRGPGSVGDIILVLVLVLALNALLAGALAVILGRHRRCLATALPVLGVSTLLAVAVIAVSLMT
ncbi:hypothetical protein ACFY1S_06510 [Micromonospora sp. NPDC000663]|uniref:hypothetical protein n=1 Tax=Micromonospora sp. NPDC000663 TaxID=3364218 RepID=UPI003686CAEA